MVALNKEIVAGSGSLARRPVGASGYGRFAVPPGVSPLSLIDPCRHGADLQDQVRKAQ